MNDRTRAEILAVLMTSRPTGWSPTDERHATALLRALDTAGFKIVRKPRKSWSHGAPPNGYRLVATSARLDAIHGTPFDRMRRR